MAVSMGAQAGSLTGWLSPVISRGPVEAFRIAPVALCVRFLFQLPAINAIGKQNVENRRQAVEWGEQILAARLEKWADEETERGAGAEEESLDHAAEKIEKKLFAELQRDRADVDEICRNRSSHINMSDLAPQLLVVMGMLTGRLVAVVGAISCITWLKSIFPR